MTNNSVLDSDSITKKIYYEKDMLKGTKVLFGETAKGYALMP